MIHIYYSHDKQFYFVINARNGRTLVISENYKTRQGVWNAIAALAKLYREATEIKDHTK